MDNKLKAIISIDESINTNVDYIENNSLDQGKLGLAIYYYYQNKFFDNEVLLMKARNIVNTCIINLEDSILNFQNKFLTDSLSNYLSNFGKGLLFIENNLDSYFDFSEIHSSIQELLIELNIQNFENKDFDISSGALACGNYFINHYKYKNDDLSKKHLREIVDKIDQNALSDDNGKTIFWRSPSLNDKIYIGISHGSAMIINFLTKLFNLKILKKNDKSKVDLLNKAVQFVLNQKRDFHTGYFPTYYPDIEGIKTTQLSICYGDLGVAYSLYEASFILDSIETRNTAFNILKSCANRPLDKLYTLDAGITYGAAGLLMTFQKIYKKYSIDDFKIAYNYWTEKILEFRDFNKKDYAGFINRFEKSVNDISFNLSFGWGLIGISIVLMSILDETLPTFDELTIIGI